MNKLICALGSDPDLAHINKQLLPQILRTIYVASGCDYISLFCEIEKATFLRSFFQYSSFVSNGENSLTPGTLADTDQGNGDLGFLAFFTSNSGFNTPSPATHYLRFTDSETSTKQQYIKWLPDIRDAIWNPVKLENQMIPSIDALYLHWQWSCWVVNMWSQSGQNVMKVQSIQIFGWAIIDNQLTIRWNTAENIQSIRSAWKDVSILIVHICQVAHQTRWIRQ